MNKILPLFLALVFVGCADFFGLSTENDNEQSISSSSYYCTRYDCYDCNYFDCFSSSSSQQLSNAVIIALTYWQTKDTDAGGLDPKIYFKVIAYQNGKKISENHSDVLLNAENISNTWSGYKASNPIPFASQADSILISAVVIEKDVFSDDYISPGYYTYWQGAPYSGQYGSDTLDYGSGLSKVSFYYEFIKE